MPLLTLATADVPAADAGLGSGITNVSQQLSGALGLALLGTVATNHSKGLLAAHHGVTSSLIGGYHLAFLAGAAAKLVVTNRQTLTYTLAQTSLYGGFTAYIGSNPSRSQIAPSSGTHKYPEV